MFFPGLSAHLFNMRFFLTVLLLMLYRGGMGQQVYAVYSDSSYHYIKELEEVVVTAEKRELRPGNIPVALTVVTPLSIPGENNPDLRSISGIVPNFYMQEGGLKLSTPIYIRGIGTVSGTPPVGLYVNGVPVFDKNAFIFDLYDIRQIEVLRGPQTTLYGRNCINGLINITTNPPASGFSLQAQVGYSGYESQHYHIVANVPAGKLYNKISYAYNKSRGYFRNLYDGKRKSNPTDSYDIRYQGVTDAARNWKIAFGANYNNSFDGGYAYYVLDSLRKDRYLVDYNTPSSYEREIFSSYANVRKNGGKMNLSSVTSYSWTRDEQMLDADFTRLDVFDNNKRSQQNLLTEELNLQSAGVGNMDWTAGLFGFYKYSDNKYIATFGADRAYLLPILLDKAKYHNRTTTFGIAAYGQITLSGLWPGMSLTAGLRYDYEKCSLDYDDSLFFSSSSRYKLFHCTSSEKDFREWLPKFSFLQRWNGRFSLYLNIAKGYKAGGYNIIANEMSSQMTRLDYDRERLWNYEAGIKYLSKNRKFNLDASVFLIDWMDQQIFVMGMMGPGIKNAGDAHSYGGEADLRLELLPGLSYILSAGYSHSAYYNNQEKTHEGNRIVMAPDFTGNTGLMYHKPLKMSWPESFTASTTVCGFGTQYFDEANTLRQNPYFIWNMQLGVSWKYMEFRIWGKNILDKSYFTYMLNNPIGDKLREYNEMGQSGSPARFGASLTLKLF